MLIDRNTIEAMIIFAYKLEHFNLVEELLKILPSLEGESFTVIHHKPDLKLVE